jgi:general secretion pathway protein A
MAEGHLPIQCHEILIEEYKQGRNVLLIIDEAQNMPIETLENLRMLSNLETSTDKLIQIVLVGQSEFEERLQRNELRQLNQRIAIRSKIQPLTEKESIDYIKHRLTKAGLNERDTVFTKGAMKEIVKQARGVPRILNILCDNALITGFGYQKKPVNTKIVREVIADFKGKERHSLLRWALAPSVALLFIIGFFLLYPYKGIFLSEVKNLISPYKGLVSSKVENPTHPPITQLTPIREEVEPSVGNSALSQGDQLAPTEKEMEISKKKEIEEKTPSPVIRIVKRGDTLFGLRKKVYGYADHKLIERVRQSNPRIKDINKILIGDEIIFPEIVQNQVKVKDKAKDENK